VRLNSCAMCLLGELGEGSEHVVFACYRLRIIFLEASEMTSSFRLGIFDGQ
jgi:hypothetical protein